MRAPRSSSAVAGPFAGLALRILNAPAARSRGVHGADFLADVALLLLRVVLGGAYAAHGFRKLGYLGGEPFPAFRSSIARRGYRPPALWAMAAIGAEVVGGALVVLGLLTPVGAAMLLAQSVTIVALVAPRGFWHDKGGIEYPALLATASLAVGLIGPGTWSLDAMLGVRFEPALVVAVLALAVAGAAAGLFLRRASPG
jgi:putative oxidoreductase